MHNAERTVAVSAFPSFAVPSLAELIAPPDLIHPDMDGKFPGLPEGLPDWLQSAMQAYSPARMHELFELGKAHGALWAERHGDALDAPARAAGAGTGADGSAAGLTMLG